MLSAHPDTLDPASPDDLMIFEADPGDDDHDPAQRPWRLMIVDDDEDVHTATLFSLENLRILGRRLEFLHAYSAAQARELLARERDVAVILLDVVMERDDAGLTLVRHIREDLGLTQPRIILRTGQPGYAPEIDAIRDYDINDYKTKSELTRAKLFTTLTASIRSYEQIRSIESVRDGLDRIVVGGAELLRAGSVLELAEGFLSQTSALLETPTDGLLVMLAPGLPRDAARAGVVVASGRFRPWLGRSLAELPDELREPINQAFAAREPLFASPYTVLYFPTTSGHELIVLLDTPTPPSLTARKLLQVFCGNAALYVDNLSLLSKLRNQAYFDSLVALPNRMFLVEEMDRLADGSHRDRYRVVLVDIDHFAEMNDALGHRYGDSLLVSVAARLRRALAPDVVLARVAGDTFGIFGRDEQLLPQQIGALFALPFEIDSVMQTVSATMGLANFNDVEGSGIDALKAASIALKRAKQERRGGFAFFTREMAIEIRARVKLLEDLRGAFASDRLMLYYQPQVKLDDENVIGLEALIRWKADDGKFIPPDHFIPLAEHSGLIVPVGEWVMRTAMSQLKSLCEDGFCGIRMAINVSVVQFRHPDFLDSIAASLSATGVNPAMVELEITESVAMLEADYMVSMIRKLKALGVQIAVDDFGTGFSSLSYLQKLAIDRLKIDQSFVSQMGETCNAGGAKSIASMVVDLGRNLGLAVIAEGVEDRSQADRLREMGCHEAQGYFFARPMDERDLRRWMCERMIV